ncbi:MAG: hypothetical protein JWM78_3439 [Verrucomicrobiaceae bacterium]|nr:hypothetical protein [Verrucomicrobiaceae bacterium]
MASRWLRLMGLLTVLCAASFAVRAEVVPDLYAVSVPVSGQNAPELQRAAASGLRELVVRISGRSDAENNPALTAALASADRYLEQYRYERNSASDAGGAPWLAQLRFSVGPVEQLLRGAGLPIWGANRPALQLWLVADDGKTRRFVEEGDAVIGASIRQQAQRRGVTIRFPKTFAGVSTDDVMQLNSAKIQASAPPQHGEIPLLGQLASSNGASWKSRLALTTGAQTVSAENDGATLAEALRPSIDKLIDGLSAQYASVASAAAEGVSLRVSGIETFDDYTALLNYLSRLAAVKSANPTQVVNNEVVVQLKIQGSIEQLMRQFALESRLTPVDATAMAAPLLYRWTAPRG